MLFIVLFIYQNKNFFKCLKLFRQKSFWIFTLGTIFGGPIGFTLTTAAILYNGASYGAILSNFSPIIITLLCFKFLRTKINKVGWLGILFAIFAFTALSIIKTNNYNFNTKSLVEILLVITAVISWAMESFFAEFTEKMGSESLSINQKLAIKSIVSSSFIPIILIPISYIIIYSTNIQIENNMMFTFFANWKSLLILLSIAILITVGRILYYYSIVTCGAARADILYYLTVIMVPIISLLLSAFSVPGFINYNREDKWYFWILLLTQVLGVFIVTLSIKNSSFTFNKYKNKK